MAVLIDCSNILYLSELSVGVRVLFSFSLLYLINFDLVNCFKKMKGLNMMLCDFVRIGYL